MNPQTLMVKVLSDSCEVHVLVFDKSGLERWFLWDSFEHSLDHDWSSDKCKWYVEMQLESRTGLWDVENLDIKWEWDERWLSDSTA